MRKRKESQIPESHIETTPYMIVDGFEINAGDIIKVQGEHGGKFKFVGLSTNKRTGSQWVDCFEIIGGISSVYRAFKANRVKRIPQRRKRAKRVV